MRVSQHASPDGPVLPAPSTVAADAIAAHHPVPESHLRTAVSDGSITIFVSGRLLDPSAVERLCAELDFATSVCRGIVTIDLTDCSELGAGAIRVLHWRHNAARTSESRYRFRVVVGCSSTVRALVAGGVPLEHEARSHCPCGVLPPRPTGSRAPLRTA